MRGPRATLARHGAFWRVAIVLSPLARCSCLDTQQLLSTRNNFSLVGHDDMPAAKTSDNANQLLLYEAVVHISLTQYLSTRIAYRARCRERGNQGQESRMAWTTSNLHVGGIYLEICMRHYILTYMWTTTVFSKPLDGVL